MSKAISVEEFNSFLGSASYDSIVISSKSFIRNGLIIFASLAGTGSLRWSEKLALSITYKKVCFFLLLQLAMDLFTDVITGLPYIGKS